MLDDRPHTVMATGTALLAQSDGSKRQVKFVIHHQQTIRLNPVVIHQWAYGLAAQVHKGLWLGQDDGSTGDAAGSSDGSVLDPLEIDPMFLG
jgi:hypothetical protein